VENDEAEKPLSVLDYTGWRLWRFPRNFMADVENIEVSSISELEHLISTCSKLEIMMRMDSHVTSTIYEAVSKDGKEVQSRFKIKTNSEAGKMLKLGEI